MKKNPKAHEFSPSVFTKMIGVKVKLLLPLGGKSWKVSPLLKGQEKRQESVVSSSIVELSGRFSIRRWLYFWAGKPNLEVMFEHLLPIIVVFRFGNVLWREKAMSPKLLGAVLPCSVVASKLHGRGRRSLHHRPRLGRGRAEDFLLVGS